MRSSIMVRDTKNKQKQKITVWPIFVGYASNLACKTQMGVEFAVHSSDPEGKATPKLCPRGAAMLFLAAALAVAPLFANG